MSLRSSSKTASSAKPSRVKNMAAPFLVSLKGCEVVPNGHFLFPV